MVFADKKTVHRLGCSLEMLFPPAECSLYFDINFVCIVVFLERSLFVYELEDLIENFLVIPFLRSCGKKNGNFE